MFVGHRAVVREGQWIDRPSVSLPSLYIFTGVELAEVLRRQGDNAAASAVFATAKQVAQATRLEEMIRGVEQEFRTPVQAEAGDSSGVTLRLRAGDRPKTQSTEPIARKPRP